MLSITKPKGILKLEINPVHTDYESLQTSPTPGSNRLPGSAPASPSPPPGSALRQAKPPTRRLSFYDLRHPSFIFYIRKLQPVGTWREKPVKLEINPVHTDYLSLQIF